MIVSCEHCGHTWNSRLPPGTEGDCPECAEVVTIRLARRTIEPHDEGFSTTAILVCVLFGLIGAASILGLLTAKTVFQETACASLILVSAVCILGALILDVLLRILARIK